MASRTGADLDALIDMANAATVGDEGDAVALLQAAREARRG